MTSAYVRPTSLLGDQTFAMPPGVPSAQKALNFILITTALAVSPTSAAASMPEEFAEARHPSSRWTNSGSVLDEIVSDRAFADAVLEIRRKSGLTWEQLASLFGVDRRSVHLWASGRPMNAAHAERLNRILAVLRRADRGTPSSTKAWLHSPTPHGILPLDLLREGRFDEIPMPAASADSARPAPLSEAGKRARAPRPPEALVAARQDRVHIEKGKLIAAVPFKVSKLK
jgi:transcriptional regulator with XRE-family HTH domain